MYINVESVEIETIDGKKVNKQSWKRQGSKPQIPGQLDMFKGKRHKKSPHSTGLAITKQSEQHLEE